MRKIAVFASGNGSNLQAIIDSIERGELNASLELVVCDRIGAYSLERAARAGIPSFAFNPRDFTCKADYELVIAERLGALKIEYLVLAGYMRIIGPTLLQRYPKRIINIHPSLLPLFPGIDGIGQALAAGVKETGVTIHFVDEGIDTGPIIAQERVAIATDETRESLAEKIHRLEHRLYPRVLQNLLKNREED